MELKKVLLFILFGIPTTLIAVCLILIGGLCGGIPTLLVEHLTGRFFLSSVFGGGVASVVFLKFYGFLMEQFAKVKNSDSLETVGYADPRWTAGGYWIATICGANLANLLFVDSHWYQAWVVVFCGVATMVGLAILSRFNLAFFDKKKKKKKKK